MCNYFDDIINGSKINFRNIVDKKLHENISVYNTSYKIPTGPKLLHTRFDKIDGFIMVFDGKIKYLVLIDYGLFDKICDKIKYDISRKRGITNSINYKNNVIILNKSVVHKNKNKYGYKIFL